MNICSRHWVDVATMYLIYFPELYLELSRSPLVISDLAPRRGAAAAARGARAEPERVAARAARLR